MLGACITFQNSTRPSPRLLGAKPYYHSFHGLLAISNCIGAYASSTISFPFSRSCLNGGGDKTYRSTTSTTLGRVTSASDGREQMRKIQRR